MEIPRNRLCEYCGSANTRIIYEDVFVDERGFQHRAGSKGDGQLIPVGNVIWKKCESCFKREEIKK